MSSFLITYDLHKPDRDYSPLYQLMAGWGAIRLTESLWMANLRGPAAVIRDLVVQQVHPRDTVAVVQLQQGTDWATHVAKPAALAWLSNNVTPAEIAA